MSDPKNRTLPETLSMYVIILMAYCADIFFFESDRTVLADAFYSRCFSLAVMLIYLLATRSSISIYGLSKKGKKVTSGLIYGTLFCVIPLFLVIVVEAFYYGITDITALDLKFSPPSLSYVRSIENLTPAIAVIIYIFTSFVGSLFKELFFRGFLLKRFRKNLKFNQANILQAVLYMFMTIPLLFRNLVNHLYDDTTVQLGIFIVMFYIVHETLAGIKWGMLTKVSGATYIATVDHFLYVFLSNSIYITNRYVTWSFMTHMLAIQIISFVFVAIYCKRQKDKKKADEAKDKKDDEASKDDKKSKSLKVKLAQVAVISPEQYKKLSENSEESTRQHHHSHHHHHHSSAAHNEANAKNNSDLIEQKPTSNASKIAEEYLEENLHKSHSHHSHHSHHHSSGSSSSEKAKIEGLNEESIDAFLRNYTNNGNAAHRHATAIDEYDTPGEASDEISDSFDADSFLESYQRGKSAEHRHHSSHHDD